MVSARKNPTWRGKSHPDMFTGGNTGMSVADADLEEHEADLEEHEAELLEQRQALIDAVVEDLDKWIAQDQADYESGGGIWEDEASQYFEMLFEPWLADHPGEIVAAVDSDRDMREILDSYRERGVSDEQLEEFFKRTDLYKPEMRPHSYYGVTGAVYSTPITDYEQEHELDWNQLKSLQALHDWLEENNYDENEAVEDVSKGLSSGTLNTNYGPRLTFYVDATFAVFLDEDAVKDGLESEFGDYEAEEEEADSDEEIIYKWKNEPFKVVRLKAKDLKAEGSELGICVGRADMGYAKALRNGEIDIWSVRTDAGRSKFTIEAEKNEAGEITAILQVKGKANRLPSKPGEVKLLEEFFTSIGIDPYSIRDMKPGLEGRQQNPSGGRSFDKPYTPRRRR